MRGDVGEIGPDVCAADEMDALSVEPIDGAGPSYYLRDSGTWQQMREYFAHRSLYHLKEGDPHAWAIPRLTGQAKAAFVAVDSTSTAAVAATVCTSGCSPTYLTPLGWIPLSRLPRRRTGDSLAVVNLMSMFGLHRELRGSAIRHFASTEITSSPGSRRLVDALERMGAPEPCVGFYREHVEADAVHEQVVRSDVVGDLVAR